MPIVTTNDIDYKTRRLTLTTGAVLDLKLEDGSVGIYAGNLEVGRISFRHYEIENFGDETMDVCRLTHAFLQGASGTYKRHGVGTEAVRFYFQSTGCKLELPDNDGIRKDDGSHLVGDGAAFVAGLKEKRARGAL